jgi:hypothetical protein
VIVLRETPLHVERLVLAFFQLRVVSNILASALVNERSDVPAHPGFFERDF